MTKQEMTEAFLIKKHQDLKEKTLQYTNALLQIELQIKDLKESIKDLKAEAKVEGIAVTEISKALSIMKKERTTSEQEKQEVAEMLEWLESEGTISRIVDDLTTKN